MGDEHSKVDGNIHRSGGREVICNRSIFQEGRWGVGREIGVPWGVLGSWEVDFRRKECPIYNINGHIVPHPNWDTSGSEEALLINNAGKAGANQLLPAVVAAGWKPEDVK